MTGLSALWLPILLSAVAVFAASSILHMLLPWHKSDYARVPNEDQLRDALRPFNLAPGDYMVSGTASTREAARAETRNQGPNLIMTVLPTASTGMGSYLVPWFVYSLVVSMFAGYVAGRALGPGAEYLTVFRFAGATAFVGYSAALWQLSIWNHRAWSTTAKSTVDGLVYALLTGGMFGSLWP